MKKLKGKDRKPVQDHAWSLGMLFGSASRKVLPAEELEQQHIALFGEIIAPLVGLIDETLGSGYVVVAGLRRAGRILRVPKLEIGQVLLRQRVLQPDARGQNHRSFMMPGDSALIVQQSDLHGAEGKGVR
jgi:hypothetical protein